MMKILIADYFELLREDLCDTLGAQAVSAALKALFNCNTKAQQGCARLAHDVHKAAQRFAVGQKIVDDKDFVLRAEPLAAHQQRNFLLISIRKDFALVQAAFDVVRLCLFREDKRYAELFCADGAERNARSLHRKHGRKAR